MRLGSLTCKGAGQLKYVAEKSHERFFTFVYSPDPEPLRRHSMSRHPLSPSHRLRNLAS
jgi:hypothetical protein